VEAFLSPAIRSKFKEFHPHPRPVDRFFTSSSTLAFFKDSIRFVEKAQYAGIEVVLKKRDEMPHIHQSFGKGDYRKLKTPLKVLAHL
jgi:hypothetical protein